MRDLRWQGCHNVRDLGGLPLVDGGATRFGVLVRADDVTQLTPAGLRALRDYGVSTVVDLRCPTEGEPIVDAIRTPIFRFDDEAFLEAARAWTERGSFYVLLLERSREAFAQAIETLAVAPGAALFHCTAGRDRTGIVAALVLSLAGVEEEAIVGDYVASQAALQKRYEQRVAAAVDEAERRRLAFEHECAPPRIRSALEHLRNEYGSAAEYLRAGGVDEDRLAALRARLAA